MNTELSVLLSELYGKAVEAANALRSEGRTDDAGDIDLLVHKIERIIEGG